MNCSRSGTAFAVILLVVMAAACGSGRSTGVAPGPGGSTAAARLSVVMILTDDQRWDTLQYMPIVQREIVDRGALFPNAFATTPLCCPSRASILTGQYAHHHRVRTNRAPNGGATVFDDSSTIATWLRQAGYRTGYFGKYLNGYGDISPYIARGWQRWVVFPWGGYFGYRLNEDGTVLYYGTRPEDYSTDVLARKAVAFIDEAPADSRILMVFAPFAPHEPATPHPSDAGRFTGLAPWRPPSYNEQDVSDKPAWVRNLSLISADRRRAGDALRQGQVESLQAVDRAVGAIVDALRRTNRLATTAIIFMSDNGLSWGEHRYLDEKNCSYEECIRLPFAVVMPGVAPRRDASVVLNIDVAPTIAQWAGVVPPTPVDGRSLVPLLTGSGAGWRADFLTEAWSTSAKTFSAVRTLRWMYAQYANGDRELYDLGDDPYQLLNVVNVPALSDVVADLRARLRALKQ